MYKDRFGRLRYTRAEKKAYAKGKRAGSWSGGGYSGRSRRSRRGTYYRGGY